MAFFGIPAWIAAGMVPGTVAAVAAAGVAALTGLYLLKLRRRRVVVAFAALWVDHPGERRSEKWARRLRRWLSLAVQLVVFGLLLLAAADPQPAAADRAGRSIVVLIDRSASMSALDEPDEPGGRLGAARRRADALVSGLAAGDRALVAAFAAGVTAVSGFEPAGDRLREAILGIAPSEEPGDLPHALAFAAAILRGQPRPTVVLVSDGAFSPDVLPQVRWDGAGAAGGDAGPGGIDVRYVPVGRRARNVAILGFAARRYPADPGSVEAALTVQNFGPAPAALAVEITAGDERAPVERVHMTLGPGERRRHLIADVAASTGRLEARLVPHAAGDDDLALDDRAFAVIPARRRLRVLRVGAPNLYLDGALASLGDGAAVRRAAPAAAEGTRASWPTFDAVIFDGVAPAPPPAIGRFLYLDPRGAGSPFGDRGVLRDPAIADARRGHPLLRQLDLADVNIAEARRLELAPDDVAVASAFGGALVVARERPGLRIAALAFDVRRSDLPMRAAFPLLIANAVSWLAGAPADGRAPTGAGPRGDAPLTALTGTSARVAVPAGAAAPLAVDVEDPTGARATWPAAGDAVEFPVTHAGFYVVGQAGGGTTIAANLGDAVESNTAPAATLTLGGRVLPPPDPPAPHRRRPIAVLALIAALSVLLVEWWTYHRRWTV